LEATPELVVRCQAVDVGSQSEHLKNAYGRGEAYARIPLFELSKRGHGHARARRERLLTHAPPLPR
jgi:hypothetical protein